MSRQNYDEGRGQCPFCKEWISIEAERCPECTSILTQNEDWLEQQCDYEHHHHHHHHHHDTGHGTGSGSGTEPGNAWGWGGTGSGKKTAGGCSTSLFVVSLSGGLIVYSLVKLLG